MEGEQEYFESGVFIHRLREMLVQLVRSWVDGEQIRP